MVYASTGNMKCFECMDVGHKRVACPHRPAEGRSHTAAVSGDAAPATAAAKQQSNPASLTESDGGETSKRQTEEQPAETAAEDSSAASERTPGGAEEVQTGVEEVQTAANWTLFSSKRLTVT